MTEEQTEALVKSVERIELALVGDEAMGQEGLIKRSQNHHSRIKRLEKWATTLVTAGGLLGLAYKAAADWWPRK